MTPKFKNKDSKFPTDFNTDEATVLQAGAFVGQRCTRTGQSCFLCQVQLNMPCVRKCVTRTEEKHSHGAKNRVFTSMITGTSYI